MPQTVEDVLRSCVFRGDDSRYRLLKLPANGIIAAAGILAEASLPFSALLADQHEVTLLLPEEVCQEFQSRLRLARQSAVAYRLITIDAILEPDLQGLIARVSHALAAEGIPILVFAAYSRDHVLAPVDRYEQALEALRSLQKPVSR